MELLVTMTITAWNAQNASLNRLIAELTDEQIDREIAPGKNTGTYLLGHLVAVSDAMLPLLGFTDKLFPALENVFIKNPDKSGLEKAPITELKQKLAEVNVRLNGFIKSTTAAEWMQRHTAVSAEAFEKEPHRNKINIIISRTSHMAYHLGQMALLK